MNFWKWLFTGLFTSATIGAFIFILLGIAPNVIGMWAFSHGIALLFSGLAAGIAYDS